MLDLGLSDCLSNEKVQGNLNKHCSAKETTEGIPADTHAYIHKTIAEIHVHMSLLCIRMVNCHAHWFQGLACSYFTVYAFVKTILTELAAYQCLICK